MVSGKDSLSACLPLILLCLPVAGCGAWDDLFGSDRKASIDPDGLEVCESPRDPQAWQKIILSVTPPLCAACPAGSHCDEARGHCWIECDQSNPCGAGLYCSCDGRCIDSDDLDTEPEGALACSRNPQLLASLRPSPDGGTSDVGSSIGGGVRQCQFDDQCPHGSHCDTKVLRCAFDCVDDRDCCEPENTLCDRRCDCRGQCLGPQNDGGLSAPERLIPRFSVSPQAAILVRPAGALPATPDWGASGQREFLITIKAPFLFASGEGPVSPLVIEPDEKTLIKCEVLGAQGPAPAAEFLKPGVPCEIASWPYAPLPNNAEGGEARIKVTARPGPASADPSTPAPDAWKIRLLSAGLAGTPQTILIAYEEDVFKQPAAAEAQDVLLSLGTAAGDYSGIVALDLPLGGSISLPVEGRVLANGRLVLRDRTKTISASGVMTVVQDFSSSDVTPWAYRTESDYVSYFDAEATLKRAEFTARSSNGRSASLRGRYEIAIYTGSRLAVPQIITKIPARFQLTSASVGDCRQKPLCGARESCGEDGLCRYPVATRRNYHRGQQITEPLWLRRWMDEVPKLPLTRPDGGRRFVGDVYCFADRDRMTPHIGPSGGAEPLLRSGDVACYETWGLVGGGPIPFPNYKQLVERNVLFSSLDADGLAAACLRELRRVPPSQIRSQAGVVSEDPDVFRANQGGIIDFAANCANLGAIGQVINNTEGLFSSGDEQTRKTTVRLIQQLLDIHSFVALRGLEQHQLDNVGGVAGGETPAASGFDPRRIAAFMEAGLTLPLMLLELPPTNRVDAISLANVDRLDPDYRKSWAVPYWPCFNGADGNPTCVDPSLTCVERFAYPRHCDITSPLPDRDDQPDGLAPASLNALAAHFKVVTALLREVQEKSYTATPGAISAEGQDALDVYGYAFRYGVLLADQVARLAEPQSEDEQIPWIERFNRARDTFTSARDAAVGAAFDLAAGENPLGIPEDDLPLFFGDASGKNSRYFSSSDYLLEKWASPAVVSAQSALSTAREAWIQQKRSEIELDVLNADRDRRLDGIRTPAGAAILENCGGYEHQGQSLLARDVIETFRDNKIDPAGCFVKKTPIQTEILGQGQDPQGSTLGSSVGSTAGAAKAICDPTEEDKRRFFTNNLTTDVARSELCRMDYMRMNYPESVEFLKEPALDWSCFFAPGPTLFCDDEEGKEARACSVVGDAAVECRRSCVDKCDLCKKGPDSSLKCRQSCGAYTSKFCDGLLSDLKRKLDRTSYRKPGCVVQKGNNCLVRPFQTLVSKLSSIDDVALHTPERFVFGDIQAKELDAVRAHAVDCASRNVRDGALPTQRPDTPSTIWTQAVVEKVEDQQLVRLNEGAWDESRLSAIMRTIIMRLLGTGFTRDGLLTKPACQVPVAAFYDAGAQVESRVQWATQWQEASVFCASTGRHQELPYYQLPASCYGGRIGEAVGQLIEAFKAAIAIQKEMGESVGRYEEQVSVCEETGQLNELLVKKLRDLKAKRQSWIKIAIIVASVAAVAAAAAATGGAAFAAGGLLKAFGTKFLAATLLSVGGAGLGGAAAVGQTYIQGKITADEDDFRIFSQEIQGRKELIDCQQRLSDANRAIRDVAERLKAVAAGVDTQATRVTNLIGQNIQVYRDGIAALETEMERPVGGFQHHFWFDEKIERFHREFHWARRLTFMAMRAVEYEFQQSLGLRKDIVAARHPDELESAVRALEQEQATRAVNRRRPEESSVVLSLRDDILQVQDRSQAPFGERRWTPAMRFKGRLRSHGFILRDRSGEYLGQGVPFNLREQRELETRCGERLWRVTATVQGDGLSPLEPGTPLLLLKRNTFHSQYCAGRGPPGEEYQVASIRPSNELFKGSTVARADEIDGFSTALLYPWFNVRRNDFYALEYLRGASEELAGRGLYGDYVLLFPKQVLEKGFALDRVEDVLIRFDYLSVDDLSPLTQDEDRKEKVDLDRPPESLSF
jgi:hypothetical protein